jgi:hypothetical protein
LLRLGGLFESPSGAARLRPYTRVLRNAQKSGYDISESVVFPHAADADVVSDVAKNMRLPAIGRAFVTANVYRVSGSHGTCISRYFKKR